MATINIGTLGFAKLIENTAVFAMRVYGGTEKGCLSTALNPAAAAATVAPTSTADEVETDDNSIEGKSLSIVDGIARASELTDVFEKTGDIQHSDEAVSLLQSLIDASAEDDSERHHLLFHLALTLCRRVEIQVSSGSKETLLLLHLTLSRALFLLRQAVNTSPPSLDTKIKYCAQIGHTATLWSTVLSSRWPGHQVLELLEQLKLEESVPADPGADKLTGFVSAVIMASTLSTAFGVTQNSSYREQGRDMYRNTLRSMREILPLDALIEPISTMHPFSQLGALMFIKDGVIPFIVQVMAVLMQRLVEVPLSSVVGRRAAALAMEKGFFKQGVEWLEQCLMLVWGQLNLRAPAPMEAMRVKGVQAESERRMENIVLAFLGLCIYVDVVADDGKTIPHPEQLAYFLVQEWLKIRMEVQRNPVYKDLFQPYSFSHIARAAQTNPVVMISLWGSQCNALILFDVDRNKCIRLEAVTEELATTLQSKFRGDDRGSTTAPRLSDIHKVLSVLWKVVVKPIFDEMGLNPTENADLDPPRLTWCPTGPTSFFPLHAAGLYDTREKGTKTYEYVASSYVSTLSILANANVALSSGEPEPFKGILAVSQPNMGGKVPITKTVEEVQALVDVVGKAVPLQWLNGEEATRDKVIGAMGSSTWIHLACHARQYPLNTSESAFLLDNGETLSLADISANASAEGELAFLSACQTAAGDFDVSEEGVHLAAGMLVAGYRSVIATTWSVRDQDAPVVAKEVYRRLFDGGEVKRTGAGLALHHATRLLRQSVGEEQFMRWAPFIHLGV
ncbi:hypothetical protein EST38_g1467 [Candolleomyces aberdarensis]|uniref:CHAT domain-containing protein n=1 Tax=Candolleomyces aberdarensis TaxID=2316362 RepID=A0A4Q2DXC1_9AGAR|nr:hypothetical protein EST38_g1467 [Candolleomyces aberdarensis]